MVPGQPGVGKTGAIELRAHERMVLPRVAPVRLTGLPRAPTILDKDTDGMSELRATSGREIRLTSMATCAG